MNQKKAKSLRRIAKAIAESNDYGISTMYIDTKNSKPKQCGFTTEVLPSGTTVTVPKFVTTIKRVVDPACQRGVYLNLKAGDRL